MERFTSSPFYSDSTSPRKTRVSFSTNEEVFEIPRNESEKKSIQQKKDEFPVFESPSYPFRSPEMERKYYADLYYDYADLDKDGVISGKEGAAFLRRSELPTKVLQQIWDYADHNKQGFLNPTQFSKAMRLVALGQQGNPVALDEIHNVPVLPKFVGISPPLSFSAKERAYFRQLFEIADADKDGVIGPSDASFFKKSNLPNPVLNQMWNLADVNKSGYLSKAEFGIALRLIALYQKEGEMQFEKALKMDGQYLPNFPEFPFEQNPTETINIAAPNKPTDLNKQKIPPIQDEPNELEESSQQQLLNNLQSATKAKDLHIEELKREIEQLSKSKNQEIQELRNEIEILKQQVQHLTLAAKSMSSISPSQLPSLQGNNLPIIQEGIPQQELEGYIKIFRRTDTDQDGFISGAEAKVLFQKSGLDGNQLAKIWDLADIGSDGKLDGKEFVIAMHLINQRRNGKNIPNTLPPELASLDLKIEYI